MAARFLADTSCIIASVCGWHENHASAATEINRRLAAREQMIVAAPVMLEAYAVLTRLPPPHRLAPKDALALIERNYLRRVLTALTTDSYRALLRCAPIRAIAGGRLYDAVILQCAMASNASVLLTSNRRHFAALAPEGLRIVVPGALDS